MSEKKKIFVVDDEEAFCKSLVEGLEEHGFNAFYATSCDEALELIKSEKPDLMTLDIRMPGKSLMQAVNGWEVLVQGKELHKDMRIIMVSATEIVKEETSLKSMGAHAVHQKPIDFTSLLATIRNLLEIS